MLDVGALRVRETLDFQASVRTYIQTGRLYDHDVLKRPLSMYCQVTNRVPKAL